MNILFTSAGRRSYLIRFFKDALGNDGKVFASNSTSTCPSFAAADECVVTPLIFDSNYIPFLLDYCRRKKIDAIFSLFDIDLPVLADAREKFEETGVRLVISDSKFVRICNDKWRTYNFLTSKGIKSPKTFLFPKDALEEAGKGNINFPLMVKPRWGMGSLSVFQADDEIELEVFFKKIRRNTGKTVLKYEAAEDPEHSVIIQEKLDGQEYGLDVINDLQGNYRNTVCKKKCFMRAGETDCAITVSHPGLKELGKKLSHISGHIGNLDCDVFENEKGLYVLEMNARFGGGYPFSHMAGVNLPLALVNWLKGNEISDDLLTEKIGVMAHKDISLTRIIQ